MKRLGLLACDSLWEPLRSTFGDYPEMFTALLGGAGARFDLVVYPVHRGALPDSVSACDAWLITGSRAGVYEPLPWIAPLLEFVRTARRAERRQAGICFGHQVLAHALGGLTENAPYGWSLGNVDLQMLAGAPWLTPGVTSLRLHMAHQDQVVRLPADARLLATAPNCHYAMFAIDDSVFGLQAHPEFTTPFMRAMTGDDKLSVTDSLRAAAMDSYALPAANALAGRWLAQFLGLDPER